MIPLSDFKRCLKASVNQVINSLGGGKARSALNSKKQSRAKESNNNYLGWSLSPRRLYTAEGTLLNL